MHPPESRKRADSVNCVAGRQEYAGCGKPGGAGSLHHFGVEGTEIIVM